MTSSDSTFVAGKRPTQFADFDITRDQSQVKATVPFAPANFNQDQAGQPAIPKPEPAESKAQTREAIIVADIVSNGSRIEKLRENYRLQMESWRE